MTWLLLCSLSTSILIPENATHGWYIVQKIITIFKPLATGNDHIVVLLCTYVLSAQPIQTDLIWDLTWKWRNLILCHKSRMLRNVRVIWHTADLYTNRDNREKTHELKKFEELLSLLTKYRARSFVVCRWGRDGPSWPQYGRLGR